MDLFTWLAVEQLNKENAKSREPTFRKGRVHSVDKFIVTFRIILFRFNTMVVVQILRAIPFLILIGPEGHKNLVLMRAKR